MNILYSYATRAFLVIFSHISRLIRIDSYYRLPKLIKTKIVSWILGNPIMSYRLVGSNLTSRLKWYFRQKIPHLSQPRKEDMSYQSILEYLAELSKSYFQADKIRKSQFLDHAELITKYNRKSIIRVLKNKENLSNLKKNCGAKVKYPEDLLLPHIEFLWDEMGKMSAHRMMAAYKDWLPYYNDNEVSKRVKFLLEKMSVSTLNRFLTKLRRRNNQKKNRGLTSTVPAARHMQNKVPINTLDSTYKTPGYIQADTVAHCGTKLQGEFINSITLTDIVSTWTVNRAMFCKKGHTVRKTFSHLIPNIPFKVISINTDSGSEFLNTPVFNMFAKDKINFTRSRPYKSNDNCYVEQKNYTHTRELFGYHRFDDKALVQLMNDIYDNYWNPLQNYFFPTFKLKEKVRVGARIVKKYDTPKTPYQRLLDSDDVCSEKKEKIRSIKKQLNPFELRKGLEAKLDHFFKVVVEFDKMKKRDK